MQLPVKARIKFVGLTDAEVSAQDHALTLMHRISSLSKSLATAPASEHGNIENEIARQRGKMDEAQRKHRTIADLNMRLRHYLETVGNVSLEDAKTKPAKVDKGETLAAAAKRIRAKIDALKSDRQKVQRCGLPIADAKKQAAEYVAELVNRGRPKLTFGHDQPFRAICKATVDGAWTVQMDMVAALSWFDPAATLQRLVEEIEAQPKPELALSAKARAEKLTALDAELIVLEFEDEALVEASEVEGPILARRPDCDPRAVLGVKIHSGKPAAPMPAAKAERVRADPPPVRMSQQELIASFGGNVLRGPEKQDDGSA